MQIFLGFLAVAAAYPGIIHDEGPQLEAKYDHHDLIGETGHHHKIVHEHAKSHQSIKFEHFHPVPVYVKKEYSHLLKHPLESGKSGQDLKQIHPETEHSHGGGLVLKDERHNTDHHFGGQGHGGFEQGSFEHGGFEHGALEQGGQDLGGYEHLAEGFEGHEGGEGLKSYAELQPEGHGYYFTDGQAHGSEGSEGYKHDSY